MKASSLAATLDGVNEALFYGRALSKAQREEAARWIAGRQGLPGSYAGMFGPTARDLAEGATLFTGDRIRTRAGTAHVLGEEACRALIVLDVRLGDVHEALRRASEGMMQRLPQAGDLGTYCCGTCTVALWRHLAVGGLDSAERRLAAGMAALKQHRLGNGRWRRFPFHYTLLALSEIGLPSAIEEMCYAAPACERYLKRPQVDGTFGQRRARLAERILAKY